MLRSSTVEDAKRRARAPRLSVRGARRPKTHDAATAAAASARDQRETANALIEVFRSRAGKLPVVLRPEGGPEGGPESGPEGKENVQRQPSAHALAPERSFFFQQRHGKVDLRALARVDLDRLVEEVDVEALQHHLENLTFGELEERDLRTLTDDNFLKLFRLAQLTLEYLLNVQHTLFTYSSTLEGQLVQVEKEHALADSKLGLQNEQLQSLRRELRQKKQTLKTYEFLLTQHAARDAASKREAMPNAGTTLAAVARDEQAEAEAEERQREMAERERLVQQRQRELALQADQLREQLEAEARRVKEELFGDVKARQTDLAEREDELKSREERLRKEIDDVKAALAGRGRGRISLAGNELEDDAFGLGAEVDRLLGDGAATSGVAQENAMLRQELDALKRALASSQLAAPAPASSAPSTGGDGNGVVEPDDGQATPPETEKSSKKPAEDEALMLKLARSHVSPELANQRSMQLRRVLRLVRRRLQLQAFTAWRLVVQELMALQREQELRLEVEALRKRAVGVGNRPTAASTSIGYEWAPLGEPRPEASAMAMLETRQVDGQLEARIPPVWVLAFVTSLGKHGRLPVAREMAVADVRASVAKQVGKHPDKIVLRATQGGEALELTQTVEGARLFGTELFVEVLARSALSKEEIDRMVSRFAEEEHNAASGSAATAATREAQWFHTEEELRHAREEIERELAGEPPSVQQRSAASEEDRRQPSPSPSPSPSPMTAAAVRGLSQPTESVPVNFGDLTPSSAGTPRTAAPSTPARSEADTGLNSSQGSAPGSESGASSASRSLSESTRSASHGPPPLRLGEASPKRRAVAARRHRQTLSRFSKAGLIRRAQVNTLNLSDDTGSSRTATSVSSSGLSDAADSLAKSGQSHFDVVREADRYEDASASDSRLEYSQSTLPESPPTQQEVTQQQQAPLPQQQQPRRAPSTIASLLESIEDDEESDEDE